MHQPTPVETKSSGVVVWVGQPGFGDVQASFGEVFSCAQIAHLLHPCDGSTAVLIGHATEQLLREVVPGDERVYMVACVAWVQFHGPDELRAVPHLGEVVADALQAGAAGLMVATHFRERDETSVAAPQRNGSHKTRFAGAAASAPPGAAERGSYDPCRERPVAVRRLTPAHRQALRSGFFT